MNSRRFTTYAVIIITILLAKLLEEYILIRLPNLKNFGNAYKSTAIRMALMIFIFYPTLIILDGFVKYATKHYLKISKKASKSSFYGLLWGVVIALAIIYVCFLKIWYHVEIIRFLHW